MELSLFGRRFSSGAGILSLMDDLGNALARGGMIMMGGGNPGHVPEIQDIIRKRLEAIAADESELRKLIGIYDPPRGELDFLEALTALLRSEYGWQLEPENICLTNGSQSAFFILFNMLAGSFQDGSRKKILLPLAPEYIGYADLGLEDDLFCSVKPIIELIGENRFKYRVDFERIEITDDIGAICVSRPTNPTGNVLTDDEMEGLAKLADKHSIPLIVDNAYGVPFPSMIYTEATPLWNSNLIVSMSLSKFGLPAVRTGIVIAAKEIIEALAGINAVANLAPSSFGAMLTSDIIRSGEIIRLSREVIQPFYRRKMELAMAAVETLFSEIPYKVHVPEGAMFLWLWFKDLPISSRELYERLKERKVLVVSGDYFFPGIDPDWQHTRECIRINYSQDEDDVRKGLEIIADEVQKVLNENKRK